MGENKYSTLPSFIDLLMNVMCALIIMFFISFMMISANKGKTDGIRPKADYIITVEWDAEIDADVDLWVQDPTGVYVNFQRREAGLMFLDRDSLGSINNTVRLPSGSIVELPNREVVTLRGTLPGEYVVNIHLYNVRDKKSGQHFYIAQGVPKFPVRVRIEKINPQVTTVYMNELFFEKVWQEKTVTRFELNAKGEPIKFSSEPKTLVREK